MPLVRVSHLATDSQAMYPLTFQHTDGGSMKGEDLCSRVQAWLAETGIQHEPEDSCAGYELAAYGRQSGL